MSIGLVRWFLGIIGGAFLLLGLLLWGYFRFGITGARARLAALFAKGAVFSFDGSKEDVEFQQFILRFLAVLFVFAAYVIAFGIVEALSFWTGRAPHY
jgi:hypothetical protein